MPFEEDLDCFLQTDDFAITATIAGSQVVGIFDEQGAEVEGIEGYIPTFTCKTADLPEGIKEGDEVIADGRVFHIKEPIRDDGMGMTTLDLEYVSG